MKSLLKYISTSAVKQCLYHVQSISISFCLKCVICHCSS